jgi:hypothetical protein
MQLLTLLKQITTQNYNDGFGDFIPFSDVSSQMINCGFSSSEELINSLRSLESQHKISLNYMPQKGPLYRIKLLLDK